MTNNSSGKIAGVRCSNPDLKDSARLTMGISPSKDSHFLVYHYGNSTEAEDFVSKYN